MEKQNSLKSSRRQFITKIMPAFAPACISGEGVFALARAAFTQKVQQSKHLFDTEIPLTIRQFYARIGRNEIVLFNTFAEAFGKEKVIALLKEQTYKRAKRNGERFRQRMGTNDFETFKTRFIGPNSYTETLIVAEIIENSKKVLELKATECVIAEAYLKANAGEFGYAYNCWGDHCWQDGYNKKIKLIRDKTLMQGHDCCNFRYIWDQ
jgi:hypothetical protein